MMEWQDYDNYSRSRHYDVSKMSKRDLWLASIKSKDEYNFVRFKSMHIFPTREEAKQWCEMYEATGGRE